MSMNVCPSHDAECFDLLLYPSLGPVQSINFSSARPTTSHQQYRSHSPLLTIREPRAATMAWRLDTLNEDVLRLIIKAVGALPSKCSHSLHPVESLSLVNKRLRILCMPLLLAKIRITRASGHVMNFCREAEAKAEAKAEAERTIARMLNILDLGSVTCNVKYIKS